MRMLAREITPFCPSCRRQLARERQQKLLAEFASKQKSFMEKNLKKDPGITYVDVITAFILMCVMFFNEAVYIAVCIKDRKVRKGWDVRGYFVYCGGAVASWLVRSTPDRVVRVQASAGDVVLCSWATHFTLTVPLHPGKKMGTGEVNAVGYPGID